MLVTSLPNSGLKRIPEEGKETSHPGEQGETESRGVAEAERLALQQSSHRDGGELNSVHSPCPPRNQPAVQETFREQLWRGEMKR